MEQKKVNPNFTFMAFGSMIYAFFYTLFLYKNTSGITYPFFVGGTCLFFFLYLKKSGLTAKMFSVFLAVSMILLGFSTCLTDSWVLLFFNKSGIFLLFFYLILHNLYEDKKWDFMKYFASIVTIVFTGIIYVIKPFSDLSDYNKAKRLETNKKESKLKYVVIGLLISFPLLMVVIVLLSSADAVFSSIFSSFSSDFFNFLFEGDVFGVTALFVFAFFVCYCFMSRISVHDLKEDVSDKRSCEPMIGITFTGVLSFIYFLFCMIQIIYLFGGLGTLPEGYTYASYAREGFFQLVFVCILNLIIVLICLKYFKSNKILKLILSFISICTYIMIASSAYRMLLYIDAYCLTFLRVFVLWALFVIFLLISGTLIFIYKDDFPFVRYSVITVTVLYILFSFAKPDYWIASYNISQSCSMLSSNPKNDRFNDFSYLGDLSMDAASVIIDHADDYDYCNMNWFLRYCANIVSNTYGSEEPTGAKPNKMSIRKWNLSRWTAVETYSDYYTTNNAFKSEKYLSYLY